MANVAAARIFISTVNYKNTVSNNSISRINFLSSNNDKILVPWHYGTMQQWSARPHYLCNPRLGSLLAPTLQGNMAVRNRYKCIGGIYNSVNCKIADNLEIQPRFYWCFGCIWIVLFQLQTVLKRRFADTCVRGKAENPNLRLSIVRYDTFLHM